MSYHWEHASRTARLREVERTEQTWLKKTLYKIEQALYFFQFVTIRIFDGLAYNVNIAFWLHKARHNKESVLLYSCDSSHDLIG